MNVQIYQVGVACNWRIRVLDENSVTLSQVRTSNLIVLIGMFGIMDATAIRCFIPFWKPSGRK